jgi:CubicO group peptidase (beta-lactamase class C family)
MSRKDDLRTAAEHGLMQGFPPPPERRVGRSSGFGTASYNRWAYLHMRELYPSAAIATAGTPVPLARRIDPGIGRLRVAREDGSQAGFADFLRETYTDAVVVVHGDAVVFEAYDNGMHGDHPHQMMSCTKSFAGLLALLAVADGAMSEDDLVRDLVPELSAASAFSEASVRQMLDMTNSMTFNEEYDDPDADVWRYARIAGWSDDPLSDDDPTCLHDYLTRVERQPGRAHGEIFHYQSPKTDVVNWITNRVTGRSFQEGLHERLWSRLGTNGETYVLLDRIGTLVAAGGLNATPNDLARFVAMMLAGGRFQGADVVPTAVIDLLRAGGSRDAFAKGPEFKDAFADGNWSYRGQWWVRHEAGREAITALGIHGQWIYVDVERGVGLVKQSSQPDAVDNWYVELELNAIDAIVDHLGSN